MESRRRLSGHQRGTPSLYLLLQSIRNRYFRRVLPGAIRLSKEKDPMVRGFFRAFLIVATGMELIGNFGGGMDLVLNVVVSEGLESTGA